MDKLKNSVSHKFDSALVKLPRAVPTAILKYTSPLGPHPFILDLPARDYDKTKRTIPVYVFLPPIDENDPYKPGSTAANSVASFASTASQTSVKSTSSKESARSADKTKTDTANSSRENLPAIDEPPTSPGEVAVRLLPVIVDFHGGGFFMGSPLEQAPFCAQMARNLSCIVLSVDYRMGPIDKFPGAITDAEDIVNQIVKPPPRPKARHNPSSYTGSWRSGKKKDKTPSGSGIVDLQNTISYKINEAQFNNRQKGQTPQPMKIKLDRNRVAICGFSSGGNIALNMAVDVQSGTPHMPASEAPWLNPFSLLGPQRPITASPSTTGEDKHLTAAAAEAAAIPVENPNTPSPAISIPSQSTPIPPDPNLIPPTPQDTCNPPFTAQDQSHLSPGQPPAQMTLGPSSYTPPTPYFKPQIPLLLFYPALDLRQLPSERFRPEALGPHPPGGPSWWSRVNDTLAPSYCPRELTDHLRASPGLASPAKDLHPDAKVFLVLCGKDTLFEQSEAWVSKMQAEGRGQDLRVERYEDNHGWTQIPETFLNKGEKKSRAEVLKKAEAFLSASWRGEDPVRAAQFEDEMIEKRALDGEDVRAEAAAKAAGESG
ncbi:MAG: hypothetical protein Q9162_004677 [Coniocarpon cinnabarinum]